MQKNQKFNVLPLALIVLSDKIEYLSLGKLASRTSCELLYEWLKR